MGARAWCGAVAVTVTMVAPVGAPSGASAHGPAVVGSGEHFLLRNDHSAGPADIVYAHGSPSDVVLIGDWNGDGADTLAVRRGNTFSLSNTHDGGVDVTYAYGRVTDAVFAGDWDGDGTDTLAVRRGRTLYVKNSHAGGDADIAYSFGRESDAVVVGNWDGNWFGDTFGVRRGTTYYLKNSHSGGAADVVYSYGLPGDSVLTGDWDGDRTDTLGVRRGNTYLLRNAQAAGHADVVYSYGRAGERGFPGDWDGNGTDTLGLRRTEPQEPLDPLASTGIDLGTLGGASSIPVAINDRGQVVGRSQTADGSWHPFLWEGGAMVDLDRALPGSEARDINNRGEVVLARTGGEAPEASVLWSPAGVVELGEVEAIKVNERGQVAGHVSRVAGGLSDRSPFLWTAGRRADLGPVPGWEERSSRLLDLNDDGVVLGIGVDEGGYERSYTWAGGEVTPLRSTFTDFQNVAVDLNNAGQVTGTDYAPGRSPTIAAYRWEPGDFQYLVPFYTTREVFPEALNDRGQVTGSGSLAVERHPNDPKVSRAVFWNGRNFSEVGPEGETSVGLDVNERAQVVGRVVDGPAHDENVPSRAFVWQAGRSVLLPVASGTVSSEAVEISEGSHVLGSRTDASGARRTMVWLLGDASTGA